MVRSRQLSRKLKQQSTEELSTRKDNLKKEALDHFQTNKEVVLPVIVPTEQPFINHQLLIS